MRIAYLRMKFLLSFRNYVVFVQMKLLQMSEKTYPLCFLNFWRFYLYFLKYNMIFLGLKETYL